jgi:hypothetical protein
MQEDLGASSANGDAEERLNPLFASPFWEELNEHE